MKAVNKDIKSKKKKKIQSHVRNIVRVFDGSANFPFIASERKRVY